MPWSVYNSNGKLLQSLAIADDSIVEGKLDVSNGPTNGYFLQAQSAEGGGLTWAAVASGPSQATQSAIEAQTNEDTYLPPDLLQHHRGVAKAWCTTNAAGGLEAGSGVNSYNTTSITDTGTGDRTWVLDTDFADGIWTAVSTTDATASHVYLDSIQVGTMRIRTETSGGSLADRRSRQVAFGDQ